MSRRVGEATNEVVIKLDRVYSTHFPPSISFACASNVLRHLRDSLSGGATDCRTDEIAAWGMEAGLGLGVGAGVGVEEAAAADLSVVVVSSSQ